MDKNILNKIRDLWDTTFKILLQILAGPSGAALKLLLSKHSKKDPIVDLVWDESVEMFILKKAYLINSLEFFEEEDKLISPNANLVLVLVENRLFNEQPCLLTKRHYDWSYSSSETYTPITPVPGPPDHVPPRAGNFDLRPSLRTLREDITNRTPCDFDWQGAPKNYTASIIKADIYAGELRLDGQTVLALREFLKDVKEHYPNFRGVILVGAFPDALLIRQWGNIQFYQDTWTKAAISAYRSDIVLADLNGKWDSVFRTSGTYPIDKGLGPRAGLYQEDAQSKFLGHYLIDDMISDLGKWQGSKAYEFRNNVEIGDEDLFGNWDQNLEKKRCEGLLFRIPLAETDPVLLSTDAGATAVNKGDIKISLQGKYENKKNGQTYSDLYDQFKQTLNEGGVVNLENVIAYPDILVSRINARNVARTWLAENSIVLDPYLERELLIEYFKRNHLYRVGEINHRGQAAIACNHAGEDEYQPVDLRAAFSESKAGFGDIPNEKDVPIWSRKNCTPDGFRDFLDQDAVLRSMLLHGDFSYLILRDGVWTLKDWLDRWHHRNPAHPRAAFYWNTACFSNAPIHSQASSYNELLYGFGMPADCLLFYGDGLAVLSQAHQTGSWPGKHPNPAEQPSPPGGSFERTLRMRRTFGETWRAIYDENRNNPDLPQIAEHRKDAYIWGIVGDWTLRLNKR